MNNRIHDTTGEVLDALGRAIGSIRRHTVEGRDETADQGFREAFECLCELAMRMKHIRHADRPGILAEYGGAECPSPTTPKGRLARVEHQIDAMLQGLEYSEQLIIDAAMGRLSVQKLVERHAHIRDGYRKNSDLARPVAGTSRPNRPSLPRQPNANRRN